jgi:hypothetical protein
MLVVAGLGDLERSGSKSLIPDNRRSRVVGTMDIVVIQSPLLELGIGRIVVLGRKNTIGSRDGRRSRGSSHNICNSSGGSGSSSRLSRRDIGLGRLGTLGDSDPDINSVGDSHQLGGASLKGPSMSTGSQKASSNNGGTHVASRVDSLTT